MKLVLLSILTSAFAASEFQPNVYLEEVFLKAETVKLSSASDLVLRKSNGEWLSFGEHGLNCQFAGAEQKTKLSAGKNKVWEFSADKSFLKEDVGQESFQIPLSQNGQDFKVTCHRALKASGKIATNQNRGVGAAKDKCEKDRGQFVFTMGGEKKTWSYKCYSQTLVYSDLKSLFEANGLQISVTGNSSVTAPVNPAPAPVQLKNRGSGPTAPPIFVPAQPAQKPKTATQ